jgi:hypothetical protein
MIEPEHIEFDLPWLDRADDPRWLVVLDPGSGHYRRRRCSRAAGGVSRDQPADLAAPADPSDTTRPVTRMRTGSSSQTRSRPLLSYAYGNAPLSLQAGQHAIDLR